MKERENRIWQLDFWELGYLIDERDQDSGQTTSFWCVGMSNYKLESTRNFWRTFRMTYRDCQEFGKPEYWGNVRMFNTFLDEDPNKFLVSYLDFGNLPVNYVPFVNYLHLIIVIRKKRKFLICSVLSTRNIVICLLCIMSHLQFQR